MKFVRLENGLAVAIEQVPNKVVALDMWVNTGSANENEELNGISHFLEHMMFKGTPRYGVGDLDKTIMNVGGVWNAGTSKDFTHYYVTVAAPFFDQALDALSDMIKNSLIDEGEFEREKQVILEEWRRKQDNPWGLIFDELYDLCFERGPYRMSVLGTFETISALDRDRMFDYYERYYAPENMILMVVGDVNPEDVLPRVEAAFADFRRPVRPLNVGERESRFRPAQQRVITRDVNETYMAVVHPAPAIGAPDEVLALDVAATLLGEGRSSRLHRRLREELRLVNTISAGAPTHRFESVFYVMATLERPNSEAAGSAIRDVLHSLADSPPSADEIAKARRILRNGFMFGMETNTGRSGLIGYYYTITGGTEFLDSYLERLDGVTPEAVSAAVKKYLTGDPGVVIVEPVEQGTAVPAAAGGTPENQESE